MVLLRDSLFCHTWKVQDGKSSSKIPAQNRAGIRDNRYDKDCIKIEAAVEVGCKEACMYAVTLGRVK